MAIFEQLDSALGPSQQAAAYVNLRKKARRRVYPVKRPVESLETHS